MVDEPLEFVQGDQVRLLTTRRVSYISHPPGEPTDPGGVWTVAAGVGGDLLLSKGLAIVRIPASDIQMYIKREDLDHQLGRLMDGGPENQASKVADNGQVGQEQSRPGYVADQ